MAKGKGTKSSAGRKKTRKATVPARKVVRKATKAVSKKPAPVAKRAGPVAVSARNEGVAPVGAPAPGALRVKKKVKRGAPPMLPRRMARRPSAAPSAEGGPGVAPALPKPTVPGSLHAPVRAPEGAEGLKARLMAVMGDLARLRSLRRTLQKRFWDAGLILSHLSEPELYQAKGYGSWEAFLEREIEREREIAIGRTMVYDLVKIVHLFQREAAEELGLDRLRSALRAIWPEPGPSSGGVGSNPGGGGLS